MGDARAPHWLDARSDRAAPTCSSTPRATPRARRRRHSRRWTPTSRSQHIRSAGHTAGAQRARATRLQLPGDHGGASLCPPRAPPAPPAPHRTAPFRQTRQAARHADTTLLPPSQVQPGSILPRHRATLPPCASPNQNIAPRASRATSPWLSLARSGRGRPSSPPGGRSGRTTPSTRRRGTRLCRARQ